MTLIVVNVLNGIIENIKKIRLLMTLIVGNVLNVIIENIKTLIRVLGFSFFFSKK